MICEIVTVDSGNLGMHIIKLIKAYKDKTHKSTALLPGQLEKTQFLTLGEEVRPTFCFFIKSHDHINFRYSAEPRRVLVNSYFFSLVLWSTRTKKTRTAFYLSQLVLFTLVNWSSRTFAKSHPFCYLEVILLE